MGSTAGRENPEHLAQKALWRQSVWMVLGPEKKPAALERRNTKSCRASEGMFVILKSTDGFYAGSNVIDCASWKITLAPVQRIDGVKQRPR